MSLNNIPVSVLFLFLFSVSGNAQYDIIPVFSDLEGESLRTKLTETYRPNNVLNSSDVKDVLYSKVYLENDVVSCIYSGHSIFLPEDEDPSQWLFGDGSGLFINLEHSYPKGRGTGQGTAVNDMHHLYPSRVDANTDRGSDPYGEIVDNQTDTWYYSDRTLSNIPSSNIDLYSENSNGTWEPREDAKGNLARASFYVRTIYRLETDAEDPDYFENMVETLCNWHYADPVDSMEWIRTYRIADYQDGKVNPFVLDCSLARLYCPEIDAQCQLLDINDISVNSDLALYPSLLHPQDKMHVQLGSSHINASEIRLISLTGEIIGSQSIEEDNFELDAPQVPGFYVVQLLHRGRIVNAERIVVVR